jgi:hypothetical protein
VTELLLIQLVQIEFYGNDRAVTQHDILERSVRQSGKEQAMPAFEMKVWRQLIEKSSWEHSFLNEKNKK